jgi:hypothetical protein
MVSREERSLAIEALEKMSNDAHYEATFAEQQAMLAVADEQGHEALKSVLNKVAFPRFHFNLTSPSHPTFGYVILGDEKVHHIDNVHEFYRALGHTDEMRLKGILAEEFVWTEYHKDDSKYSEICLQVRIIKYLTRHSETFIEKYAAQCDSWLATCLKKCMSNSPLCMICSCNPNLLT